MATRTQLLTADLGTTGLEITRVGLGAWAIGGTGYEFACGMQDAGFRRPSQVDPILLAASFELSDDDLAMIGGAS